MKRLTYLVSLFVAGTLLNSCREFESLPIIPEIKFKSYQKFTNQAGKDSILRLTFSYIDGDGDLGLTERDTLAPFNFTPTNKFYYNIFIDIFEFKGGKFTPVLIPLRGDTVKFLYRMDVLTPDGKNKAIKGEISTIIDIGGLGQYPVPPQLIKFGVQITDRQLHLSNWVESPQILTSF